MAAMHSQSGTLTYADLICSLHMFKTLASKMTITTAMTLEDKIKLQFQAYVANEPNLTVDHDVQNTLFSASDSPFCLHSLFILTHWLPGYIQLINCTQLDMVTMFNVILLIVVCKMLTDNGDICQCLLTHLSAWFHCTWS